MGVMRNKKSLGAYTLNALWFPILEKAFFKLCGSVEKSTDIGPGEVYSAMLGSRSILL